VTTPRILQLPCSRRLGVEFDPDAAWNERKRICETSNLIIDSTSITAYAEGDAHGRWTCAVAAAVFRFTCAHGASHLALP
jgi:arginine decarboxylase